MHIFINKAVLIVVFSAFVPGLLLGQQKNVSSSKAAQSATQSTASSVPDDEIVPADVEIAAKKIIDRLKGDKEICPVPVTLIMSYSGKFLRFSKYPKIEADTKISTFWYKDVAESLSNLAEVSRNIEMATFNGEEKQLEELNKIYKDFVSKIIYLLEHPKRISGRK